MQPDSYTVRALVLAAMLSWALPVMAQEPAAAPESATAASPPPAAPMTVVVAPGHVDPAFDTIGEGFAEFIRQQLQRVGLDVRDGRATRRVMAVPSGADASARETPAQLARARATGARVALLADLRPGRGVVEVDLRAYALDGRSDQEAPLVGGALGVGTLSTLSATTNPVLLQILPLLDPSVQVVPPGEGLPDPGQLAAATTALALLDAGALTDAWKEVDGLDSPFLSVVRSQIEAAAKRPGVSLAEKARLLIAQGRVVAGWRLVFDRAQQAIASGDADATLLVAAGEAQLAQGNARGAIGYFAKSVEKAPRSAAASMGLARAYESAHRLKDARKHYERAAALAPSRIEPLRELASLPSSSPSEQARYLFEAGQRSSRQLRAGDARANLERAVRLDSTLAASANDTVAELHGRMGNHADAIDAYTQAIAADRPTADRLRGVARARHALRDVEGAEATYLEVLQIDHNDVESLRDLGDLYVETGNTDMAVVRLERAESLSPERPDVKRSLAKALQVRQGPGDLARALSLHERANERGEPTAADLESLAELQQAMGQPGKAIITLERTLRKRQLAMYARQQLSDAYRARGDTESAEQMLRIVRMVSGDPGQGGDNADTGPEAQHFDALLDRFVVPGSGGQRVVFLGLARPKGWRDTAVEWLHPHAPDLEAIERGVLAAINRSHQLVGIPIGAMEVLGASRGALFDFDASVSRSAELVTFANLSMETDAVFLGRLLHPMGSLGAVEGCGSEPYYVLELRKLGGQADNQVSILASQVCVEAGVDAGFSVWNHKAALGWGLLALVLLRPFIRGWGRVRVTVKVPKDARALFSITISRRPKKFKEDKKDSAAPAWRFEKRLQTIGGARRLKGSMMTFSIVPARRKPYYITVRGPLLDLATEKLVGEFLEEKTIRVRPWRTNEIKFTMQPEQTAITVKPKLAEGDERQVQVALRGKPQSLRFTANGVAYLYADKGEHVVVVGAGDRVLEFPIQVESAAPVELEVDLNDFDSMVFRDVPDAVGPYVEADFRAAAEVLEAAGEKLAAERTRALHLRGQGDTEGAAQVLESAGMHSESVELRSRTRSSSSEELAPELLEKAGEHARAGEVYESRGDYAAAARNYEQAYDYQRAADCYGEIGETEKVLTMLESLGDVYEAGKAAAEANQIDRAIHNLQQVDSRHGFYSEACRLLAELLIQRGELDLAVTKYGEALEIWGDSAPLEMQQSYAELLEQADRQQDALTVYEGIRRRDVQFGDVATRIEELKKQLSTVATPAAGDSTTAVVGATPEARIGDENSRYEIIEELGRGGMGVVFRARDRNLGRVVALKVLPENLRQHPQAVKLFLREARAAAALNHQNIVTLFDAGQEGDSYFITMECLDGAGLDQVLAGKGTLPTKAVATVGLQVAAGLDYAQRAKIVHRDIKPSNLFLTRDRTVKIMDFGLAKMVEEVRRGSTVIGGTPNFMAPEQATGGAVDHRTDLYALGGTLFQLVTGTVPYESGDVVYHHVHTPPPDARERNVEVPDAMAELLMKMMAKEPADRVQSARELAAALQGILKPA